MKTTKNSKKNETRVLIASLSIAAVAVAGATFAWFTSKDEVTNRLSASANYGTEWAEDFTPPEDWLPGQEINKDAGIVNTGNVDAFVRAWLEGEMNIVKQKAASATTFTGNAAAFDTRELVDVADASLSDAGLKKSTSDGATYYKLLHTTERANDAINGSDADVDDNTYDEVKAVQAGGWLAFASNGAAFNFTPEQAYPYVNASDENAVGAAGTAIASSSIKNTWTAGAGLAIDSDTFVPTAAGLYIFRRNVDLGTDANTYEYSGYYFDGTNYYALKNNSNNNSDYTIDTSKLTITYDEAGVATTPVVSVVPNGVELYEAQRTVVENSGLTWTYTSPAEGAQGKLTATYGTGADAISIDVALSNIVTDHRGETWTALGTGAKTTFYYNNDLEAGDTTSKLVDSVTLSSATKKDAYIAFDFDLNLKLESVQVSLDNTGNETVDSAKADFAGASGNAPTKISNAVNGGSAPEVDDITWTAAT